MNKMKVFFGLFALVIAATWAFAFVPKSMKPSTAKAAIVPACTLGPTHYWVKFDCAVNGVVQPVAGNYQATNGSDPSVDLTGLFQECDGNGNICAIRYPCGELDYDTDANAMILNGTAQDPENTTYPTFNCAE